jgi:hypothetical protein
MALLTTRTDFGVPRTGHNLEALDGAMDRQVAIDLKLWRKRTRRRPSKGKGAKVKVLKGIR